MDWGVCPGRHLVGSRWRVGIRVAGSHLARQAIEFKPSFLSLEPAFHPKQTLEWRQDYQRRFLLPASGAFRAGLNLVEGGEAEGRDGIAGGERARRSASSAIYSEGSAEAHEIAGGADVFGRHSSPLMR